MKTKLAIVLVLCLAGCAKPVTQPITHKVSFSYTYEREWFPFLKQEVQVEQYLLIGPVGWQCEVDKDTFEKVDVEQSFTSKDWQRK